MIIYLLCSILKKNVYIPSNHCVWNTILSVHIKYKWNFWNICFHFYRNSIFIMNRKFMCCYDYIIINVCCLNNSSDHFIELFKLIIITRRFSAVSNSNLYCKAESWRMQSYFQLILRGGGIFKRLALFQKLVRLPFLKKKKCLPLLKNWGHLPFLKKLRLPSIF